MKLKFGAIVTDGSGKIGGHVVSKNRSGSYLRTKVTPSNPNTAAQALARSILASLSTAWGNLTDSQRQSWNDAVSSYASTDIFGDIKNPSGINLFVKLNANLLQSSQAILDNAPAKIEIPFSAVVSMVANASTSTALLTLQDDILDSIILRVQASGPVNNGVSNVKSKMRNIGYVEMTNDNIDLGALYEAKFGSLVAGQNIVFSIAPIMTTGQQGTAQTIRTTVVA